jgi:hypothetical protein
MAKKKFKGSRIDQLTTQYALRNDMGAEVYTDEILHKALFDDEGKPVYFIKKGELKEFAQKKIDEDPAFDVKGFVDFLQGIKHPVSNLGVIKEGGGGGGQRATTIDSAERAFEVANRFDKDGKEVSEEEVSHNAEQIQILMSRMVAIRNEVNPFLDQNATVSIAIKNKKTEDNSTPDESVDSEEDEE